MNNAMIWFLGLVGILVVGTFLAIPDKEPIKTSETVSKSEYDKPASESSDIDLDAEKKSLPDQINSVNQNLENTLTNNAQDNLTNSELAESPNILQVTMAQVKPDGSSVFGGTGPAGATILVFNGDILIAEAEINQKGDWVAIPDKAFDSGSHLIQFAIKQATEETKSGQNIAESNISSANIAELAVVIDVDVNKQEKPLVVFVPKSESSVPLIVQAPKELVSTDQQATQEDTVNAMARADMASTVAPQTAQTSEKLRQAEENLARNDIYIQIRSLSWEDDSNLRLSGFANGGHSMQGYFDQNFISKVTLDETVKQDLGIPWSMVTYVPMQSDKNYNLKAELLDKNEKVIKQTEIKVSLDLLSIGRDGSDMLVIHKGDVLWRIAYKSYGESIRYVDIFKRNISRIDNPDLIFPNQVFAIPK